MTPISEVFNEVIHMDNRIGIPLLPDKCANLIISDPPYFRVKGEFDFTWKSFDEYLKFMRGQAELYNRVLADNGTLFVWGNSKIIAYVQVIMDKYFTLHNSILWRKKDSIQYQYYSVETARSFTTHNERLLMYSKGSDDTGLDTINKHIKPIHPFAKYMREEMSRAGVRNKEISVLFPSKTGGTTGCVSNWCNGNNIPTKEQYLIIRRALGGDYFQREYEDLRKEYEDLRRPFYNELKLDEVFEFSQESHSTRVYDHCTVKPEKLTRAIIRACSRKNDLVLVPFAGSGTECAMSVLEGRRFVAFDNKRKYVDISNKRVKTITAQQRLFQ